MEAQRLDNVTPVETASLPQNIEAEAALLGAMMIDNKLVDPVADIIKPEHFFEPLHARIFEAVLHIASLGRVANPVTLRPLFTDDPAMKEVGGPSYLAQLTGSGAALIGAIDFARQIKELAQLRAIIGGLIEIVAQARDTSEEVAPAKLLAKADALLSDISDDSDEGEQINIGTAAMRVVDNLGSDRNLGIRSGIEALDATLGAIQPQDSVILAARPSMGKTATAISYAIGAAKRGHGTLFISREMSSDQLAERALADMCFDNERTRVPFNAITTGNISSEQGRNLARASGELAELPLTIIDVAHVTPAKISRLIKRHKRRFAARGQKLELVIVDYLQLVESDERERDPYARVSSVSRGLKSAAKANNIGMMALCQLSRAVEQRADKRPMLSDLRDSGQIEQDADSVVFLLRPEYYLHQARPETEEQLAIWEEACHRVAGVIEFIVPKRRRGVSGTGRGAFYGAYQAVR
jgi:replicative DNA helicase